MTGSADWGECPGSDSLQVSSVCGGLGTSPLVGSVLGKMCLLKSQWEVSTRAKASTGALRGTLFCNKPYLIGETSCSSSASPLYMQKNDG